MIECKQGEHPWLSARRDPCQVSLHSHPVWHSRTLHGTTRVNALGTPHSTLTLQGATCACSVVSLPITPCGTICAVCIQPVSNPTGHYSCCVALSTGLAAPSYMALRPRQSLPSPCMAPLVRCVNLNRSHCPHPTCTLHFSREASLSAGLASLNLHNIQQVSLPALVPKITLFRMLFCTDSPSSAISCHISVTDDWDRPVCCM